MFQFYKKFWFLNIVRYMLNAIIWFLGKLDPVVYTKDSCHKMTRSHELVQKYKYLQFQPILFRISRTLKINSINSHNSCLVTWCGKLAVLKAPVSRSKAADRRGPIIVQSLKSSFRSPQPPGMHTWNGLFCNLERI